MKRTHLLEEKEGIREVAMPRRGIPFGPPSPRNMKTQNQKEIKPFTLKRRQRIVAVLDRLKLVAVPMMEMLDEHPGYEKMATDQ